MTPSPARAERIAVSVAVAAVVAFLAMPTAAAQAGAIVSNGTVKLGVNDQGHLNFTDPESSEYRGLTYVPTGNDGTRAGCECEGWGAGALIGATPFQGRANRFAGVDGVQLVSFTSNATTATSVVDVLEGAGPGTAASAVGDPALRVTHEFKPSPNT